MAHELTTGIQVELAQQAHEASLPLYTGAQDQGLDEHAERGWGNDKLNERRRETMENAR